MADEGNQGSSREADQRESARFRVLAGSDHDAIMELGPDGRIYYASPNYASLAGYDGNALDQAAARETIHPDDLANVARAFGRVFAKGESVRVAYRAKNASGAYAWAETCATPFTAEDGSRRAMLVSRDISSAKDLEHRFAETESRLKLMMDNAYDVIAVYAEGGRLLYANRRSKEVFGWGARDVEGKDLGDLIHPEDRERVDREMSALAGRAVLVSQRVRRADGSWCWIESNSSSYVTENGERRVVVVARDMSEREQAQALLRASENRYRQLVERSPAAIVVLEGSTVSYANPAALELFGIPDQSAFAGREIMDFVDPDDAPQLLELCQSIGDVGLIEFRVLRPDGSRRIVMASGTPTEPSADDGQGGTFQAVLRDTTSLREAQDESRQLALQLERALRMESLGVLAGGVAHDFNNLLQVILGNARMAQSRSSSAESEMLDDVIDAGETAARLTQQLLAYAGRRDPDVRPVDLSEHVRSFTTLLEAAVPKKVALHFDLADDLPPVMADVSQFEQVLLNLVRNGGESHGDGAGSVVVSTGWGDVDAAGLAAWEGGADLEAGGYAWLEVRDEGSGMDEATRARIFDPFFSTKSHGHGLGLSAALGLVRAHKGGLSLQTALGQGTRFRVHFPIAAARPAPVVARSSGDDELRATVLVVDDEPAIRRLVRRFISARGGDVLEAVDGVDALEVFREHADVIDVVLLDLSMPRRNGIEALRDLREQRSDLPVLLASGFDERSAASEFTKDVHTSFIDKPFRPRALVAALHDLLGANHSSSSKGR